MGCQGVETASFKDQPESEVDRLMHMVVVGGGPTGVEYAGELHDFLTVGSTLSPSLASLTVITVGSAKMVSRDRRSLAHHTRLSHRSGRQQGDSRDPIRSPRLGDWKHLASDHKESYVGVASSPDTEEGHDGR